MLDIQIHAARIVQDRCDIGGDTQSDGKGRGIATGAGADALHRTRQGEPGRTVFQRDQLGVYLCRLFEDPVNVP